MKRVTNTLDIAKPASFLAKVFSIRDVEHLGDYCQQVKWIVKVVSSKESCVLRQGSQTF